jgi:predicted amidohydrolase YtcJ
MDAKAPHATALAVRGERILAVGDDASVRALIGDKTRVVQLEGRSLTPGLSDAHCHLYGLGKSLESVNLRDIPTPEAAAAMVAEASKSLETGEWAVGRGWDQNLWPGESFPNHAILDAVASDRPVALRRVDGHALWANAIALEMAGIDKDTKDPPGGKILRDAEGNATGVLIDMAMDLVESKIPKPTTATIKRRIMVAAKEAASVGITSVHEMGISDEVANVYRALADEGRLPVRVYAFLAGDLPTALALGKRNLEQDRDGTQFFVMRAIKLFADGALGSRGAAMLAPYSDDKENRGLWLTEADDLEAAALAVADAGWQLGVHAIGDAGNRAVLDAFEAAYKANPSADLRFRVEHAQIVAKEDLPRFAALGVIASMQPTHATSDMPWAEERVGKDRIAGAYAWRTLLDSGAHLAAGSDFPVERVPPLLGVYAAVTRQDASGEPSGGWLPEQKMSLEEALVAFTRESAYAAFAEQNRGVLQAGFIADLTIYDRALAADSSLLKTSIDMTVVGGAVKFERE